MNIVYGNKAIADVLNDRRQNVTQDIPAELLQHSSKAIGRPVSTVEEFVRIVLNKVQDEGDAAILELAKLLDGSQLTVVEVSKQTILDAYDKIEDEIVQALQLATDRSRNFHEKSFPNEGWFDADQGYGEIANPVGRVGAYVPGGSAPLPSTAIMTIVPARVAGVNEVILVTPPGETGSPDPTILVAADLSGVDRIFQIGGAQAIAAMAFGTNTVPAVDMICGPGNIFVTTAKKLLFGDVGIDGIYGPTETLIVADESANPTLCAADLLAQAEHDVMATPIMITTSRSLAMEVCREIEIRGKRLDRRDIALKSVERRGCVGVVDNLQDAFSLANKFGPEHISLSVEEPWEYLDKIRNVGAIFVGELSHEVLGDYVAGPSHVMPTGGSARFGSGLNVRSFLKISPIIGLDDESSLALGRAASTIGRAEGLTGHAEAAEIREELQRDLS